MAACYYLYTVIFVFAGLAAVSDLIYHNFIW